MQLLRQRWLKIAMALCVALGHLLVVVHRAEVTHELCAEHGQQEHGHHRTLTAVAGEHLGSLVAQVARYPAWYPQDSEPADPADDADHDSCDLTLFLPLLVVVALLTSPLDEPAAEPATALHPQPILAACGPRYRLAPKNSPPLA